MKHFIITCALAFAILAGNAQNLPFSQLKDSAVHYFQLYFSTLHQSNEPKEIMAAVDKYFYYRKACLAHFRRKKDKRAFIEWMATQRKKEEFQ